MRFGIKKVGIDQAGKQQADIKHCRHRPRTVVATRQRRSRGRQELQAVGHGAMFQSAAIRVGKNKSIACSGLQIRRIQTTQGRFVSLPQPNVMSLDRQCGRLGAMIQERQPGTLRPMIEPRILAVQARLKAIRIFPDVVQQAGKMRFIRPWSQLGSLATLSRWTFS